MYNHHKFKMFICWAVLFSPFCFNPFFSSFFLSSFVSASSHISPFHFFFVFIAHYFLLSYYVRVSNKFTWNPSKCSNAKETRHSMHIKPSSLNFSFNPTNIINTSCICFDRFSALHTHTHTNWEKKRCHNSLLIPDSNGLYEIPNKCQNNASFFIRMRAVFGLVQMTKVS